MPLKSYRWLITITAAIFVSTLIWPQFYLTLYDRLTASPVEASPDLIVRKVDNEVNAALTQVVQGIDFYLPTSSIPTAIVPENDTPQPPAAENRLVIPRMGVDATVYEGPTQDVLRKGLWHIPGSAFPGEEGNVVITAHRWLYRPPSPKTFYLIDKLVVGDPIYYYYEGKRYFYEVSDLTIVDPEDVQILNQDETKLTLFTCHPLFTTKQRYVVSARLVSVDNL